MILYGSYARGEAHEGSDWDFLILTNKEFTPNLEDEFFKKLYDLELEFELVISSIIENEQNCENYLNSEFYRNVETDGIDVKTLKVD